MSKRDNKQAFDFHRSVHPAFMEISAPLRTLGLKDYSYFKGLPSGEYLLHMSNLNIVRDQFQKITELGPVVTGKLEACTTYKNILFLGGDVKQFDPQKEKLIHLAWGHNFWNRILLFRANGDKYVETWGFSLGRDHPDPLNFFINRMDLLERFITYFDVVAEGISRIGNRNQYARFDQQFQLFHTPEEEKLAKEALAFLQQTSLDELTLKLKKNKVRLTKREGQCFYFLQQNYTAKEIGQTLNISPRTVETFLNLLKEKMGIDSKADLIRVAKEESLEKPLKLLV